MLFYVIADRVIFSINNYDYNTLIIPNVDE